ncbi:hypothetical protein [Algoriphagus aquimarinus]|uniref:Magnesium citrate secondary transporter n=1 Tax=Algoriphagus aquimarinus TaxID=237018 RepID=A0A5C7AG88_9BACT|nr:hypothetical protein [Algoriphagus aquimarinus]TXE02542.1 hypothetical protein ESV85_21370 [Algoriphagus aquimarinus]
MFNFLKIIIILLVGYVLASHYRPFQNSYGFFDFGLADSGVGLVSVVVLYHLLTPPYKNQTLANTNALLVLFVFVSQEVFCFFFPGPVGTFDFSDLIYYFFGYAVVYLTDVTHREIL